MSLSANSQAGLEQLLKLLLINSIFSISTFSNILQKSLSLFFKQQIYRNL